MLSTSGHPWPADIFAGGCWQIFMICVLHGQSPVAIILIQLSPPIDQIIIKISLACVIKGKLELWQAQLVHFGRMCRLCAIDKCTGPKLTQS